MTPTIPNVEEFPKGSMRLVYRVPPEELTDGTITLRKWRVEDAEAIYEAAKATLPDLIMWMTWASADYSLENVKSFIEFSQKSWEIGQEYNYAILLNGVPTGACSLVTRPDHDGIEIGYWVGKPATGRGYATRASHLLTKAVFGIGGHDVRIRHDIRNVKSEAIPRRLGFTRLGTVPCLEQERDSVDVMWQMTATKVETAVE